MTRGRAPLWPGLRISLAAAATTWLAMLSWRGFTEASGRFLVQLVVVGAVVALVGGLLRWRRVPGFIVVVAQVAAGVVVTSGLISGTWWPGEALGDALATANDSAQSYAAPVPVLDGVTVQPLLLLGGLAAMLLVDLCAATLRRVPLAGLPLLAVYSVPVSMLGSGLSWWVFALTAAGFLLMLFLQEEDQLRRWGRSLDGGGEPVRRLSDAVRASALTVGTLATVAAIVLPLGIPTLSLSVFSGGSGDGGDGGISVNNPLVDLRRDLTRDDDVPLITIDTDDPSPDHFRVSVLNRFNDNEFSSGDREVPTSNGADGPVPSLDEIDPAYATVADRYDYAVSINEDFESTWLPTQSPIDSIAADGDWRYDAETLDFIASEDDLDTRGVTYSMTALDLAYDDAALAGLDVSPSDVADELTALPDGGLPPVVADLARQVTGGETSSFAKAVALQQFFRKTGGFRYSLDQDTGPVGVDELSDFLDAESGRVGYCEQFAAAMAVMAREVGIPSRIAVGFLQPTETQPGSGTWVYSSDDFHAWVELYFPGAGWVLFDPTPAARVAPRLLPSYSELDVNNALPTATGTEDANRQSQSASASPQNAPPDRPSDLGSGGLGDTTLAAPAYPWLTFLGTLLLAGLVVLLGLLPRTLRERQRSRRRDGDAEAVWDELRATCVDLRLAWPEGRSPRETEGAVSSWFGAPGDTAERPARGPDRAPEATAALAGIVDQVERSRYARSHEARAGALRVDVDLVTAALRDGAAPRVRRRARWLPASAISRPRTRGRDLSAAADRERELVTTRVDHL